MPHNTHFIK